MVLFYPDAKIGEIGYYEPYEPEHLKGIEILVKPEWIKKIREGYFKISLDRKSQTYSFA